MELSNKIVAFDPTSKIDDRIPLAKVNEYLNGAYIHSHWFIYRRCRLILLYSHMTFKIYSILCYQLHNRKNHKQCIL